MFFRWIKLLLEQWKTVMSILVLLGVSGVSIYGNVNEFNPWARAEAIVEEVITPETPVKIIETRVESGITKQEVQAMIDTAIAIQDEEWH
jgi:spore cortex formation protein SpoVR/YcgB (stage V sporulation)